MIGLIQMGGGCESERIYKSQPVCDGDAGSYDCRQRNCLNDHSMVTDRGDINAIYIDLYAAIRVSSMRILFFVPGPFAETGVAAEKDKRIYLCADGDLRVCDTAFIDVLILSQHYDFP